MTDLLRQAIAQIERLPASEQDSVASRILEELADDEAWAARFTGTTDEQWDRLAECVRQEIAGGAIHPLDDVFPSAGSRP